MSSNFEELLKEKRQIIWAEIEKYLKEPLSLPEDLKIPPLYSKEADFHWQVVSEYPQRKGKYLRPILLLLTAEALGVSEEKALKTAAAMQISEDWILGHDDFEDDSMERRGDKALHRLYGPYLAVNAGDALHVVMWKVLSDNKDVIGTELTYSILDEFYQMLTRTILGQTVEIKWRDEGKIDLTDEDCFFIIDGKTVYYTIAGPMRLGAILAGATKKQLGYLYEFAKPLGRCFQIKDDLLDLTSDFAGLKKQKGNDIYESKRTIMLMHLFRSVDSKEKKKLGEIMSKKRGEKTKGEVDWVLKLMKKYKSLEYGQNMAEKLAEEARGIFKRKLNFLVHEPARGQLEEAITFILKREY
ncbi:MAG: polyprenyl synthetase family protein [bacterium]|nr:polyprenyl synthetase family protein [bacterium]